jgi:hypothetical protein
MKAIERPQAIIYTTLFILLALIALILSMSGCMSERIEGNGDLISQDRPTQPFSEVVSQGSFSVVIIPADNTRVVVKAESNILPYLYTTSDGTTMTIGYKNDYNIHEHYPVEVILYTPVFSSARLSGSGTIECSGFEPVNLNLEISGSGNITADFHTENLMAAISGSGNMNLSGTATNSTLNVSGSGNLNSLELEQQYCIAGVSGSGNITTSVIKKLDAVISGSGSIYYVGNPAITNHINGSGKVIKY